MVRDKSKLPISFQENKKVKLMVCDIRESCKYKKEISQINYLIHTATAWGDPKSCLLYTSPSPRDATLSRMPSSA